jgi:hypothetical protein
MLRQSGASPYNLRLNGGTGLWLKSHLFDAMYFPEILDAFAEFGF